MNYIMKIIKSLEKSGFLIKGVSEKILKWSKRTKRRIFWYANSYIRCQFVRKFINRTGKGAIATSQGWGTIRAGETTIRAGEWTNRTDQDF